MQQRRSEPRRDIQRRAAEQPTRRDDSDGHLTAGAVATGTTLERIQTGYATAIRVQVPRDRKKVMAEAVEEAALIGEDYFFAWDITLKDGTKKIVSGLSINGARSLQRCWGNNACDILLEDESDTHWTYRAVFIDLETGVTTPRLFRQRKPRTGLGKMDMDRVEDMDFQKGQSKAIRNAIEDAIPLYLITACMKASKEAATQNLSKDLNAERQSIVERAESLGVPWVQLARKMGKKISKYTADDIVLCKALLTTVEQGHAPIDVIFPNKPPSRPPAKPAPTPSQFDVGPEEEAQYIPPDDDPPPERRSEPQGQTPSKLFVEMARRIVEAGRSGLGLDAIKAELPSLQKKLSRDEFDELSEMCQKAKAQ